jgi:hypothetical protein
MKRSSPPFCAGTTPSVWSVRAVQNGIFCRTATFRRMGDEGQQPGTVAPAHNGMGATVRPLRSAGSAVLDADRSASVASFNAFLQVPIRLAVPADSNLALFRL